MHSHNTSHFDHLTSTSFFFEPELTKTSNKNGQHERTRQKRLSEAETLWIHRHGWYYHEENFRLLQQYLTIYQSQLQFAVTYFFYRNFQYGWKTAYSTRNSFLNLYLPNEHSRLFEH